jgi:hypothetical protein
VLFAGCACVLLALQGGAPRVGPGDEEGRGRAARVRGKDESKESAPGKPFRLPDDEGGALLGKVLPPRGQGGPLRNPDRPTRRIPAPAEFTAPGLELPPSDLSLPRLPAPRSKHVLRPHLLDEEELGGAPPMPAVPRRPAFYAGRRIHTRSVDVNIPPALPPLAEPVPDRVSLEDATLEASTEAALAAPQPLRTTPAPYRRVSVPDPYEHRRPLVRPVPPERASPVTAGLVTPKP